MIRIGNGIGTELEAVCDLFSCDHKTDVVEYLKRNSESPLQVPFHYLQLIRMGKARPGAARPAKATAEQVELGYRAILQRPPENAAVVRHHLKMCRDRGQLIMALLSSKEAIARMPQLYARAFPLARRLWHAHIPKTAGTSFFIAAASSGWGFVNTNRLSGAAGDLQKVASAVHLGQGKRFNTIISGHWHLPQYADSIGAADRMVVFVRDPVELLVSEFNYAVDVVNRGSNVHQADPAPFLKRGLDPDSFTKTYQRGFFVANVQCSYLSTNSTCAAALRNLAACNARLLPSDAVDSVVSELFPTVARRKVNVSTKRVRSVEVDRRLREEIMIKNHHDVVLNAVANMRYRKSA